MNKATARYRVAVSDSLFVIETTDEIVKRIYGDTKIDRNTRIRIKNRLYSWFSKNTGPIPIFELIKPKIGKVDAWKTGRAENNRFLFSDVEGFDNPATAWQVWEKFVKGSGRTGPCKREILTRLINGIRGRDELTRSLRIKKTHAHVVVENKSKSIENIEAILEQSKEIQVGTGRELPPMKDWKPDNRYYRRNYDTK